MRRVFWDKVLRRRYIPLVISRDPAGREKDDSFFTTDTTFDPDMVIALYAYRRAIEDTFRIGKQYLGIEEPQSWKRLDLKKSRSWDMRFIPLAELRQQICDGRISECVLDNPQLK